MNPIASVLAVTATPATSQPADPAPWWMNLVSSPLLILVGGFFLVTTLMGGKGGKRGEEKARLEALKQLKRGDRIQTIGGILGAVVRVEENRVELKVDESSNVKIWFARTAISRVVDADKAEAK